MKATFFKTLLVNAFFILALFYAESLVAGTLDVAQIKKEAKQALDKGDSLALVYIEQLKEIAKDESDSILMCYAIGEEFSFYIASGDVKASYNCVENYKDYINVKNDSLMFTYYNVLGTFYRNNEVFDQAIVHYQQAYFYAKKAGLKEAENKLGMSLSMLLIESNRFEEGVKFLDEIIENEVYHHDTVLLGRAYFYRGFAYYFNKQFDVAAEQYHNSMELVKHKSKRKYLLSVIGYADCLTEAKRYDEATKAFQLADSLKQITSSRYYDLGYAMNYGRLQMKLGNYKVAEENLLLALDIAKESKYTTEEVYCYRNLKKLNKAKGEYKEAYRYLELESNLSDSVWRNSTKNKMDALSAELQLGLKDGKIRKLNEDVKTISQENEISWFLIKVVLGVLAVILVYVLYVIVQIREKNKAKKWLEDRVNEKTKELLERNKEIEQQSKEKSLMLKEIHHRVKNNMQLIISFIRLENHFSDSKTKDEILEEVTNRIHAVAAIHEKLYQAKDFVNRNVQDFLPELAKFLFQSFQLPGKRIELKIDVDDINLTMEKMIPIGLILNELISNSFKYGFKDKSEGFISLSVKRTDNDNVVFTVRDSGIGLPEDFNLESANVGFHLIDGLVNQISGELETKTDNGAVFTITFPIYD